MQHKRAKPLSRFEDFLKSQPTLPPRPPADDTESAWQYDMHETLLCTQASYIKKLLCETLPGDFKGIATKRMDEPVRVIWRLMKRQYSLSNAAGVVGLVTQFMEIVNADFKSVEQLFQDLNAVRSQVNVNSREALNSQMLTSQLMLVMVLGVLPSHMWGSSVEFTPEGFTLEKVTEKLNNIYGNQSKAETMDPARGKVVNRISAVPTKQNGSALGKRKASSEPDQDRHYNQGWMKCHYCASGHNGMNNIGPHKLVDHPNHFLGWAAGVQRRNIFSKPIRLKGKAAQVAKAQAAKAQASKGKGKTKEKAKRRREIPLEECQVEHAVDAVELKSPAIPTG
ncbi:hypothetical protein F443_19521 [Phytophthora nicotianae P1569]|uniref:Uncharacterized protein n=4 Tax=Phytophthora nicotianae TaxID=4792 RepID=V9E6B6_PHYNI|nr:hypothetical protein F443_19521 [Phytophthora nicotianae P1569]